MPNFGGCDYLLRATKNTGNTVHIKLHFKSRKSPFWVFHRVHEGPVCLRGTIKKTLKFRNFKFSRIKDFVVV